MNSSGISCDRHGGNLHTKHGDSITWHSQDNKSCFILEFYSFNDNTGGPSGWPFQEAEPDWKKGVVECKGTVKKGTGVEYFKYTIYDQARTKQLDPIIIVDRN
jgi:hypothetical protein